MKTIITSICVLALFPLLLKGQSWNYVGAPFFSAGNTVGEINIQTLSNGTPIAGYAQSSYNAPYIGGGTVKYYNGTDWENLGTNPLVTQNPKSVKVAIDHNDNIYAAVDVSTVIKIFHFSSGNWVEIGEITGVFSGSYSDFAFKIDRIGTPYVVYRRMSPLANIACKKYNGTDWVDVGDNNGIIASGEGAAADIGFDENNIPYVALSTYQAFLYKYNSGTNNWTQVHQNRVTGTDIHKVSLEVVSSNEIYIGSRGRYIGNFNYRPSFVKYDGTNVIWMDSTATAAIVTEDVNIRYHNGNLYRAYNTGNFGSGDFSTYDLILEKWDEINGWEEVVSDLQNLTQGEYRGGQISIAFSGNSPLLGIPYYNGSDYKATVIGNGTIGGSPNISVKNVEADELISIYPNPFSNKLIIDTKNPSDVTVRSILGQVVFHQSGVTQIHTENWSKGAYIVTVEMNGKTEHLKVIKK